jgi:hypothetical protein
VFGAAFGKPLKGYTVTETGSMAGGETEGKFIVKLS